MIERIRIGIDNEEVFDVGSTGRELIEFVVVCKSGNIYVVAEPSGSRTFVSKLGFPIKYSEHLFTYFESTGGKKEFLQFNSHHGYICITQKYGLKGLVLNLENPHFRKEVQRGDYQSEHCTFPVAFFSEGNSTYLIHGSDWNRLDITDLASDKLLTERVIGRGTSPNYFDYFHSSLSVSQDSKHFASNGWVWGPCDIITVYSIEEFLKKYELAHSALNFGSVDGYNWDRPMCWIDNRTIGVGYNRKEDGESNGSFRSEIIFVDILLNEVTNRITFDGFALSSYGAAEGNLYFDRENGWFIGLNRQTGLLISDINGKHLSSNNSLTSHKYSPTNKFVYRMDQESDSIEINKLH